ncbi:hypothetical protein [Candidatus Methanomassiliicoccus intestinalis]|jgi:hypothetical protein|uniref:Uncharacterized protein n=1 Tax=Methanomassiliicoccus intestinalis (strain Issoire-Mx1) TaxID=1295009 RepID=R9T820_METII|nr:hypothetical protein [Candidatus Methanomassiliicoccus intestinalis]AGN25781.1 hypothetical protein MMINT_03960 [Candidatus Methanomassiliicoccus intestinalis Issoire-Mx1]
MTRKCQRKSPVKSNVPTDMLPEIDEFVRRYHLSGRGDALFLCFRIVRQIMRILYIMEKLIPLMTRMIECLEKNQNEK